MAISGATALSAVLLKAVALLRSPRTPHSAGNSAMTISASRFASRKSMMRPGLIAQTPGPGLGLAVDDPRRGERSIRQLLHVGEAADGVGADLDAVGGDDPGPLPVMGAGIAAIGVIGLGSPVVPAELLVGEIGLADRRRRG